jgi:uncharacterized protein with HEPN domain
LLREWRMYWLDMRIAASKIQTYTLDLSEADFATNELVKDAVLRNLEIIGEAAKYIPDRVRQNAKTLEWRRVIGFRNIVAHAYFGIDRAILWNIISEKVPELLLAMDQVEASADYRNTPGAS